MGVVIGMGIDGLVCFLIVRDLKKKKGVRKG
jgi:hypothetical protein